MTTVAGAGHHAVPGRLAGAVADLGVAGREHRLVAAAVVPGQGADPAVLLRLAARHAAPDPVRPADDVRLEGAHPGLAGLDPDGRDRPGVRSSTATARPVYIVGGAIVAVLLLLAWRGDVAAERRRAAAAEAAGGTGRAGPGRLGGAPGFPVPPLDLPHYHGVGVVVPHRRPAPR